MKSEEWRGRRYVVPGERLAEACRWLGIRSAVELRVTDYWGGATAGRVIGFDGGTWRVGLDTYLSARAASRTLWHELVHIAQAQEAGGLAQLDRRVVDELRVARLFGRGQRQFFRVWAYNRIPTEKEAEQMAKRCHRAFQLAAAR